MKTSSRIEAVIISIPGEDTKFVVIASGVSSSLCDEVASFTVFHLLNIVCSPNASADLDA
jgi:hypothetical protein